MSVAGVESMTIAVPFGSMMYKVPTTLDLLYWETAEIINASVVPPRPSITNATSSALKFRIEVPFISHSILPLLVGS